MPWKKVSFSMMKFSLPLKIYTKKYVYCHISERYPWMILKLCQINGLILGLNPVIFPSLVNFV